MIKVISTEHLEALTRVGTRIPSQYAVLSFLAAAKIFSIKEIQDKIGLRSSFN
jgi:hypothetical protein